jgi:predicted metal-dependent hydrolase
MPSQPPLPFDASPVAPLQSLQIPVPADLYYVRHPRARRYVIRVDDAGRVRVTMPRWGSRRDAEAFVRQERAWIERQQGKREVDRRDSARIPPLAPEVERELRLRAKRELPARLLELAAAHGLRVARVSVRNQKWRWGSCAPNGHISLNWRLVLMADDIRDYVLIHELMHLRRMDHSPRFWKLVAAACPDYQQARAYLRRAGFLSHAQSIRNQQSAIRNSD